jgi:hypothetical protein
MLSPPVLTALGDAGVTLYAGATGKQPDEACVGTG